MQVDPIEASAHFRTLADLQRDLTDSNGFTDAELAINRSGRIAPTQVPRLLLRAVKPFMRAATVLLGSLLILFVAHTCLTFSHMLAPARLQLTSLPRGLVSIAAARLSGNAVVVAVIVSMGAALALLGASFKAVATVVSLLFDLVRGLATCIEGRTSVSLASAEGHGIEAGERLEHHYYIVQDQYMQVTIKGYLALRAYSGSTCKVYITPFSKLLLSIEPVKVRIPN